LKETWIEILYFDGAGIHIVYGTIDVPLETVLAKRGDEWVRLNKARWLNESGTVMELYEDDLVGTEGHFYLRASSLVALPRSEKASPFGKKGKPLTLVEESQENN
jgi:hypothetical protein